MQNFAAVSHILHVHLTIYIGVSGGAVSHILHVYLTIHSGVPGGGAVILSLHHKPLFQVEEDLGA